jgi:hypothetical protein
MVAIADTDTERRCSHGARVSFWPLWDCEVENRRIGGAAVGHLGS